MREENKKTLMFIFKVFLITLGVLVLINLIAFFILYNENQQKIKKESAEVSITNTDLAERDLCL